MFIASTVQHPPRHRSPRSSPFARSRRHSPVRRTSPSTSRLVRGPMTRSKLSGPPPVAGPCRWVHEPHGEASGGWNTSGKPDPRSTEKKQNQEARSHLEDLRSNELICKWFLNRCFMDVHCFSLIFSSKQRWRVIDRNYT